MSEMIHNKTHFNEAYVTVRIFCKDAFMKPGETYFFSSKVKTSESVQKLKCSPFVWTSAGMGTQLRCISTQLTITLAWPHALMNCHVGHNWGWGRSSQVYLHSTDHNSSIASCTYEPSCWISPGVGMQLTGVPALNSIEIRNQTIHVPQDEN